MKGTLSLRILGEHLVKGEMKPSEDISIKIDQTLTQDATGTMAYLQFEALGIPKVRTELSVSYIDHNTLQQDFKNPDDHRYLQSVAARYGIILSKAGNGICHQVHLERFARPGRTLVGSDSHTPTAGGIGELAIGVGGLDVALAMAGNSFRLKMPEILGIRLSGKLQRGVAAKDVILEVLRRMDVKGGVGKILEYHGPGVESLSVPERATITNMGAETGATTSIFPSDEITRDFLRSMGREGQWVELKADEDAEYDEIIEINLSELEPLIAQPHSPGNVTTVKLLEGMKVHQVAVGSCTNSSFKDLMTAAAMLKGKSVHPDIYLAISPGSRTVLEEISRNGALATMLEAGARILESACGPCIGQGFAPPSKGISIRTFNRNFEGRSGTKDAKLYLTSVETAVASAITGKLTDPRGFSPDSAEIEIPELFRVDDSLVIYPPKDGSSVEIIRGPNIAPLPPLMPLPDSLEGEVLIKVEDNITTDHIMPAGRYLPLRSNIPEYAKHVFEQIDPDFHDKAMERGGGIIVGGENYGQGSSREHAALCPKYLGIKAVVVKSFARIHLANLINFGILPLIFVNPEDYERVNAGDRLRIDVRDLNAALYLENLATGERYPVQHGMSRDDIEVMKAGGKLPYVRSKTA